MSAAREIISALVDGGMDPVDAASLVAAAAVELSANSSQKTAAAIRQQRYRDRNKRNESVTQRNAGDVVSSVTNRNETVTDRNGVTPPSISLESNKEKKERAAQIPETFKPDEVRWIAACRKLGTDGAENELKKFIAHHRAKGTTFKDWNFGWDKWLASARDWAPKPQAGVGVVDPGTVNWRAALESFKKYNNWPRGHGNDPTSPACRAPPELLREFGLELRRMDS